MMKKIAIVGLAVAASGMLAGMSASADSATAGRSAQETAGTTYEIDTAHTQVVFSVDRFGFDRVWGRFDQITGAMMIDQAHPERSSVRATIPIASLDTGNDERDGFLRGRFWLKGDSLPKMEFQSISVRMTSPTQAEVVGHLSLAGIEAPVTLNVVFNKRGTDMASRRSAIGFSASGSLSRSAFGIRTATPNIGDEVKFQIEALGLTGEAAPPPVPPERK